MSVPARQAAPREARRSAAGNSAVAEFGAEQYSALLGLIIGCAISASAVRRRVKKTCAPAYLRIVLRGHFQ
jgi:hypothetical protein